MNNIPVFAALASKPRMDILKSLSYKPKGINKLSEELELKSITVRHHIRVLMQAGLIDTSEEVKGTVGRPEVHYKICDTNIMVSFPKRNYQFLSENLVDGLTTLLGVEETQKILKTIGVNAGIAIVKDLEEQNSIKTWTPEVFSAVFLMNMLAEMGTEPEIVTIKKDEVVYREHNCMFLDLAKKNPKMICDSLDDGFHAGIIKALGPKIEGKKLKCMGHGDRYCEYSIKWQ